MIIEDVYVKILDIIRDLGGEATTYEIIKEFKKRDGKEFLDLMERYGCEGGKGSGRRYTPYVYLGKQISNLARKGWILSVGWRKADEDEWSAPKVKRWKIHPRLLIV